jgi:3-isopropylmalate/(R)-2-methylmalate dehydratase small subunit
MKPFRTHSGLAVPLDRANVDTDQIIPKQFLKRIERTGFGQFLFFDWRFDDAGQLNQQFILNDPRYRGASILVAGPNFGCGSSREHAVWALQEFGIAVIIASSFADIFANNCLKNGVLPVTLPQPSVELLMERAANIHDYSLAVSLETCTVTDERGFQEKFALDETKRAHLLAGLDDIELSLANVAIIREWEIRRKDHSWLPSVSPDR